MATIATSLAVDWHRLVCGPLGGELLEHPPWGEMILQTAGCLHRRDIGFNNNNSEIYSVKAIVYVRLERPH